METLTLHFFVSTSEDNFLSFSSISSFRCTLKNRGVNDIIILKARLYSKE